MEPRIGASLSVLLLVGCAAPRSGPATPRGSLEPHGGLGCAGQTIEYVEHDPRQGRIHVEVRCEQERLIVDEWSDHGRLICRVHADEAAGVWEASRRSRAREALWEAFRRADQRRGDRQAVAEATSASDPGGELDPWLFNGGSCTCQWPDDPRGEHCWDHPCRPPPAAPHPAEVSTLEREPPAPPPASAATLTTSLADCDVVVY